jgi:hypothetical protein
MTETSFERALKRFDPALWLARRHDGNGWNVMGINDKRRVYTAMTVPIGELGMHIIENLHKNSPHRNGASAKQLVDQMEARERKIEEDRLKARKSFSLDLAGEIWENARWKTCGRVAIKESITVTDSRRNFNEHTSGNSVNC